MSQNSAVTYIQFVDLPYHGLLNGVSQSIQPWQEEHRLLDQSGPKK